MDHRSVELEGIFSACFLVEYQTILVGGHAEPNYRPSPNPSADPACAHRVEYREDFFASALHEVAHWCLAGSARRMLDDYGYWYSPDGRSDAEQAAFERVEARPQALEWIFSDTCAFTFHLSADNLLGGHTATSSFAEAVERARREFVRRGLPLRAERFREALEARFR